MTEQSSGDLVPFGRSRPLADMSLLAEQLVASAAEQGVQLTGADGLLTALTRQVLQTALEVEMADHLGYDRGDLAGRGASNIRNGTSPKTVRTEIGEVLLMCLGIGLGRSSRRSCPSISVGWRASTRPSCRCMRRG